eukprot:4479658-Amphidinium_carterae.3
MTKPLRMKPAPRHRDVFQTADLDESVVLACSRVFVSLVDGERASSRRASRLYKSLAASRLRFLSPNAIGHTVGASSRNDSR